MKTASDPIPRELVGLLLTTVMMAALFQTIHITTKAHKPQFHMPRCLPNVLHYYCILCAHIWCGHTTICGITSCLHPHCSPNYRNNYLHSHALYYSSMYAIQKSRINHTKCMMTMGMKGGARTVEQVSSSPPLPLNQITLPIPQLPGFLLTVADSTLPGAGQGLFTLKHIEVDDYLCTYEGSRLSQEDLPRPLGPENDYIWSNSVGSTIIDAFHYLSCFGRYANDALYEYQCNAMIVMHNGKVKLRATRDILPNEEIFVHYGGGYWADRFHTLGDSSSVATLSTLQKSIIEAYSLILLANGKAIQRTDLLNTWSSDTLPDITQMTGPSLSPHTLALCHDTYGSYGTVSLSLSYGRTNKMSGKLITSLIHTLQTHQSRHHVNIMRDFLNKHEDVCKLYLWRKRNGDLYTACTPNGTCGYQFLHQMHNRSVRQQKNLSPDQFEVLTSRNRIDEHRNFIQALIDKYSPLSSICNITRTAVSRLTHYLKWLSSSPRPKFLEEQHWLGSDALFRLSDSTENHYTYLAIDPASTITYISPEWLHCVHDSEFSEETPSLSITELDHIIRRNNFGFFENKHYQPLPTTPNLPIEVNKALASLARRLISNTNTTSTPKHLVIYKTVDSNMCTIPIKRIYHKPDFVPTPTSFHSRLITHSHIDLVTIDADSISEQSHILPPNSNTRQDATITDGYKITSTSKSDSKVGSKTKHPTSSRTSSNNTKKTVSIQQFFTSSVVAGMNKSDYKSKLSQTVISPPSAPNNVPSLESHNLRELDFRTISEPDSGPYMYRDMSLNVPLHLRISSTSKDYNSTLTTSNRLSQLSEESIGIGSDSLEHLAKSVDSCTDSSTGKFEPVPSKFRDMTLNVPLKLRTTSTSNDYTSFTTTSNRFSLLYDESTDISSVLPEYLARSDGPRTDTSPKPLNMVNNKLCNPQQNPTTAKIQPKDKKTKVATCKKQTNRRKRKTNFPWDNPQWAKSPPSSPTITNIPLSPEAEEPLHPLQLLLETLPASLDIHHLTTDMTGADIRICTLNVNTISHSKLPNILSFIKLNDIDVMICTDTRHATSSCKFYTNQIKKLLGKQTRVLHSATAAHENKKAQAKAVGGQIIILTKKWSKSLISHFSDPSQLGIVSGLYLKTGLGQLLIMGSYWPSSPKDNLGNSNGLWDQTSRYLKKIKSNRTPVEYIHTLVSGKADRHTAKSSHNRTILCGDMNSTNKELDEWASSNNWANPSARHAETSGNEIHTYFKSNAPVSWIDHHLISPISSSSSVTNTSSSEGDFWDDVSDHRPIWIDLLVPGGIPLFEQPITKNVYLPKPRSDIDRKDTDLVKEFQHRLNKKILGLDPHPTDKDYRLRPTTRNL